MTEVLKSRRYVRLVQGLIEEISIAIQKSVSMAIHKSVSIAIVSSQLANE